MSKQTPKPQPKQPKSFEEWIRSLPPGTKIKVTLPPRQK
jgi:hypothetical protein